MMEPLSRNLALLFGLFVLLALVPLVEPGENTIYFISIALTWGLFAASFDLAFGVAGMLSFGHAAFFGLGGYAFAIATSNYGVDWFLALVVGGVLAGMVGGAIGAITMRVGGLFFALTSLAVAEFINILMSTTLRDLTGGHDGFPAVPRPDAIFGIDFYDNSSFFYVLLVIIFVCLVLLATIKSSPFGRLLLGMKNNPVRTAQLGFNVNALRIAALSLSAFFSGIAGAVLASLMMFISPQALHWMTSGDVLIMALLGGTGTLFGPLVGALLFEAMRDVFSALTVHWYGLLGLAFVIGTIYMPDGIISLRLPSVRRLWRNGSRYRSETSR